MMRWLSLTMLILLGVTAVWLLQKAGLGRYLLGQAAVSESRGACYVAGAQPRCLDQVTRQDCQSIRERDIFLAPFPSDEKFVVSLFRPSAKCLAGAMFLVSNGENIVANEPTKSTTAYPQCLENLALLESRALPGGVTLEGPFLRNYKGWTKDAAEKELGAVVPEPNVAPGQAPEALYRATCGKLVAPRGTQEEQIVRQPIAAPPPQKVPPRELESTTRKRMDRLPIEEARHYLDLQLEEHPESITQQIIDAYFKEREAREKPGRKLMQEEPVRLIPGASSGQAIVQPPRFIPKFLFPAHLIGNFCQRRVQACEYPDTFSGRLCQRLALVTCEI